MAAENQLRARLQSEYSDITDELAAEKYGGRRTEAEREIFKEGLAAMGYLNRPTDGTELFLWYLRRIGLVLGFVGLILMGYGVFGPRVWSIMGFANLLGGFLFVALEEGIRTYEGVKFGGPEAVGGEQASR